MKSGKVNQHGCNIFSFLKPWDYLASVVAHLLMEICKLKLVITHVEQKEVFKLVT